MRRGHGGSLAEPSYLQGGQEEFPGKEPGEE